MPNITLRLLIGCSVILIAVNWASVFPIEKIAKTAIVFLTCLVHNNIFAKLRT